MLDQQRPLNVFIVSLGAQDHDQIVGRLLSRQKQRTRRQSEWRMNRWALSWRFLYKRSCLEIHDFVNGGQADATPPHTAFTDDRIRVIGGNVNMAH